MAKKSVEGQMDLFEIFGTVEELEETVKKVTHMVGDTDAVMYRCYKDKVTGETAVIAYLNYHKVYIKMWKDNPVIYQFESSKEAVNYYVDCMEQFMQSKTVVTDKEPQTLYKAPVVPWKKE